MTDSQNQDENPYRVPEVESTPEKSQAMTVELKAIIKKYKQQVLALGIAWIFIGALAIGIFAFVGFNNNPNLQIPAGLLAVVIGSSAIFVTFGILTLNHQVWAFYGGLIYSILSLIGNVINFNFCGILILIALIVQASNVIKFSKQIKGAGLPLKNLPKP